MSVKTKKTIGFLGLGTMGFPMCYGLSKAGFRMILPAYRRTVDQAAGYSPLAKDEAEKSALIDEMLQNGAVAAASQKELLEQADIVTVSYTHLHGYFGKDVYMENDQIFTGNFGERVIFHDYNEVDMEAYFKDIDLLVLEVNEPSISGMSFGFIDYVLEHPDVYKRQRRESIYLNNYCRSDSYGYSRIRCV